MNYAFARQEKAQDIAANAVVVFQTKNVVMQLKKSTGDLMDTGHAQYYSGGWHDIGDTSGGQISIELLPLSYQFSMNYAHARQEKSQNVNSDPTVIFQTKLITVKLQDHSGGSLDTGHAQYYSSGWQDIGDTSGGAVSIELLPLTYNFSMNYAHARQEKSQNVNSDATVIFQTKLITVKLQDHSGGSLDTGHAQYYSGGWHDIGDTSGGQISIELLPLSYQFSMNYAHARQEKSQNVNSDPTVIFQTKLITVKLQDHSGGSLDTGHAQYYSGGWQDIGDTSGGAVSIELLPLSYQFSMQDAFARQEKSQNVNSDATVIFQTGQAHSDSGTATQYYAGGWHPFAQDMELLPVTYTFHFSDGTGDTPQAITAATVNHIHEQRQSDLALPACVSVVVGST